MSENDMGGGFVVYRDSYGKLAPLHENTSTSDIPDTPENRACIELIERWYAQRSQAPNPRF